MKKYSKLLYIILGTLVLAFVLTACQPKGNEHKYQHATLQTDRNISLSAKQVDALYDAMDKAKPADDIYERTSLTDTTYIARIVLDDDNTMLVSITELEDGTYLFSKEVMESVAPKAEGMMHTKEHADLCSTELDEWIKQFLN